MKSIFSLLLVIYLVVLPCLARIGGNPREENQKQHHRHRLEGSDETKETEETKKAEVSETTTSEPKETTEVSTTNSPSTKQGKSTQNSKSTNDKNKRSNKRKGQKTHSQHHESSLHLMTFKFSDKGGHTEHKVKLEELLLKAILEELKHSKITKEKIQCHFSDEGDHCDFRVSNQVSDKQLTHIKENFKTLVKGTDIGVTDVELKHQAGKKGGKEGESAGGKEKENAGRGRNKKGKNRKNREGAPQEQSSSSTVTVLAVVICFLLLGLLVVFMYKYLCKKKLEDVAPRSKKSKKRTKKMGKQKFSQLENNFSTSSEDEVNN